MTQLVGSRDEAEQPSGVLLDVRPQAQPDRVIERDSTQPDFWNDNGKAQGSLKEKTALEKQLKAYEAARRGLDDVRALLKLASELDEDLPVGRRPWASCQS